MTACLDWENRILTGQTLVPELPSFPEEADRALRVFKRLRVPDIYGTPTHEEICAPWIFDLVRALFGCYDAAAQKRLIREFFVLIPKKNGKSTTAAAIMVTAAIVNRRPAAELLLIAPTKKIADIAFAHAAGIIKLDPELVKIFHLQAHQKTIRHRVTDAMMMVKAADADVITGSKATYVLLDETHVFSEKANAAGIFVEIRGSLASRPDGFLLQITTQSKAPPAGVFKSELQIARAVRDGEMVLPLLPIMYELPEHVAENGGWKNEVNWPLVNPNLNRSVDPDFLRDELMKAEREGAEQLSLIASQHFNVQVGLSLKSDRWRGADYWQGAADESISSLDDLLERSEVVTVGIDGGGLDDLFGLAVIGRCKTTRDWLVWNRAWVHSDVLELRKDISQHLQDFQRDGDLVICSEPTQDVREVADIIERINQSRLLPPENAVGLDPYMISGMVDELATRGVVEPMVRAIGQGTQLSPAVWGLERKLKDGTLWHAGQPMMTWVLGNAKAEQRGNAVLVTKQTAGKAKIDPLVATFDAAMLMARNPAAQGQYQILVF